MCIAGPWPTGSGLCTGTSPRYRRAPRQSQSSCSRRVRTHASVRRSRAIVVCPVCATAHPQQGLLFKVNGFGISAVKADQSEEDNAARLALGVALILLCVAFLTAALVIGAIEFKGNLQLELRARHLVQSRSQKQGDGSAGVDAMSSGWRRRVAESSVGAAVESVGRRLSSFSFSVGADARQRFSRVLSPTSRTSKPFSPESGAVTSPNPMMMSAAPAGAGHSPTRGSAGPGMSAAAMLKLANTHKAATAPSAGAGDEGKAVEMVSMLGGGATAAADSTSESVVPEAFAHAPLRLDNPLFGQEKLRRASTARVRGPDAATASATARGSRGSIVQDRTRTFESLSSYRAGSAARARRSSAGPVLEPGEPLAGGGRGQSVDSEAKATDEAAGTGI